VHYVPGVMRGKAWVIVTSYILLSCVAAWAILSLQSGADFFSWRPLTAAGPGGVTPFHFWAGMAVAILPYLFLWPAYLRMSPGRVDILEYGLLGSGAPRVRHIDLRGAKVLVMSSMRGIVIEPPDGPPLVVQCGTTLRWHELVRALFNAARSKHPTPAMPDDALVG
jgi:hypothetical protein